MKAETGVRDRHDERVVGRFEPDGTGGDPREGPTRDARLELSAKGTSARHEHDEIGRGGVGGTPPGGKPTLRTLERLQQQVDILFGLPTRRADDERHTARAKGQVTREP